MQTLAQAINEALLLRNVSGISAEDLANVVRDHEQQERELFAAAGTDRAAIDLMIQQKLSVNLASENAKLRELLKQCRGYLCDGYGDPKGDDTTAILNRINALG